MKDKLKKKYNPAKQPCRQGPEREDCFARNRVGNCDVLTDTGYPCGRCPFYKPETVLEDECLMTYERLIVLERADLIGKYEMRDRGLSGSWTAGTGRRRI